MHFFSFWPWWSCQSSWCESNKSLKSFKGPIHNCHSMQSFPYKRFKIISFLPSAGDSLMVYKSTFFSSSSSSSSPPPPPPLNIFRKTLRYSANLLFIATQKSMKINKINKNQWNQWKSIKSMKINKINENQWKSMKINKINENQLEPMVMILVGISCLKNNSVEDCKTI